MLHKRPSTPVPMLTLGAKARQHCTGLLRTSMLKWRFFLSLSARAEMIRTVNTRRHFTSPFRRK